MKKYFLGVFFAMCSSFALAKSTYLDCEVSSDGEKQLFSVKIDEESGKITHSQPGGFAFNTDGFFTAEKISYQKIDLDGIKVVRVFEISRTDLSAQFITEMSSPEFPKDIPKKTFVKNGACKLVEVKNRKF